MGYPRAHPMRPGFAPCEFPQKMIALGWRLRQRVRDSLGGWRRTEARRDEPSKRSWAETATPRPSGAGLNHFPAYVFDLCGKGNSIRNRDQRWICCAQMGINLCFPKQAHTPVGKKTVAISQKIYIPSARLLFGRCRNHPMVRKSFFDSWASHV